MKRCIFVGPSLHGVTERPDDIEFLPPARRGDLTAAVGRGIRWIGLIDGYFGTCASVWHKEILYALSIGCHVWGAASMGALRAAECHQFGMRPIGSLARRYAAGEIIDDAEVALLHGPSEVDYLPFTEALVDVRCTVQAMLGAGAISDRVAHLWLAAATSLHFGVRTVETMASAVGGPGHHPDLEALYETHRVKLKQADALLLMRKMAGRPPSEVPGAGWRLAGSSSLRSLIEGTGSAIVPTDRPTVTPV